MLLFLQTGQYIASYVGTIRTEACVEYAREENAYVFGELL
jgi:hypothetical protein